MEITSKINDHIYSVKIVGAIVGTYAEELNRLVHSINFIRLGISNLVFDLAQTTMIDSIGLEAIHNAQKQGLRVSVLNSQGVVKDMLERARINETSSILGYIEKENLIPIPAHNETQHEMLENIFVTSER